MANYMKITPVYEYFRFNVDGVILNVKVDYKDKKVSFIDELGNKNKFTFTDRGREYLGGWVKVFRALEEVTLWCDERLKLELDRRDREKEKEVIDLMVAVADLEAKK